MTYNSFSRNIHQYAEYFCRPPLNYQSENVVNYSCEEGIQCSANGKTISSFKLNYKEHTTSWLTRVTVPELPDNSKWDIQLIDQSTNIWKYEGHISYYDGTKSNLIFYLNIMNGNISDNVNTLSIGGDWGYYDMNTHSFFNISFGFGNKGTWSQIYTSDKSPVSKQFTYTFDGKSKIVLNWADGTVETCSVLITDTDMELTYGNGHKRHYKKG